MDLQAADFQVHQFRKKLPASCKQRKGTRHVLQVRRLCGTGIEAASPGLQCVQAERNAESAAEIDRIALLPQESQCQVLFSRCSSMLWGKTKTDAQASIKRIPAGLAGTSLSRESARFAQLNWFYLQGTRQMNRIRATFKEISEALLGKALCLLQHWTVHSPGSVLRHRDASHSYTTVATVVASSKTGPLRRSWAASVSLLTRGDEDSQDRSCPS